MASAPARNGKTKPLHKDAPRSRAAQRELRKQQLIDSTIDSIAKRGFSETTLADVADGAGLSRGIVNFHFQSKDQLLVETLQYLSEEYSDNWERALRKAGPSPAERLIALVKADFEPAVCNRKKVATWSAFWGEAKSRPTYLKLCAERDKAYADAMLAICQDVIDEGGYPDLEAQTVADGLSAITDGLWLDLLMEPSSFDRERAKRVVFLFLSSVFPKHLTRAGEALGAARENAA